ncbi:uncharacterized protein TNCV_2017011 [Trichonephila clavipes]|nr:uncharacterized protein TNCV_2017011 [Trichonephila clavipes]
MTARAKSVRTLTGRPERCSSLVDTHPYVLAETFLSTVLLLLYGMEIRLSREIGPVRAYALRMYGPDWPGEALLSPSAGPEGVNDERNVTFWFKKSGGCGGVRCATATYIYTLQDVLFIYYKQSPDNACLVAFSQFASSPCLIEEEIFNDSEFINNLIDYEDGQEEPDSLNMIANSTQEIDDQVSNLTTEILNAHASASRPFYQTERPYVQGELKGLIKERNKARKTWQQTRHPQHKTELNRLENIIKKKNLSLQTTSMGG